MTRRARVQCIVCWVFFHVQFQTVLRSKLPRARSKSAMERWFTFRVWRLRLRSYSRRFTFWNGSRFVFFSFDRNGRQIYLSPWTSASFSFWRICWGIAVIFFFNLDKWTMNLLVFLQWSSVTERFLAVFAVNQVSSSVWSFVGWGVRQRSTWSGGRPCNWFHWCCVWCSAGWKKKVNVWETLENYYIWSICKWEYLFIYLQTFNLILHEILLRKWNRKERYLPTCVWTNVLSPKYRRIMSSSSSVTVHLKVEAKMVMFLRIIAAISTTIIPSTGTSAYWCRAKYV